MKIVKTIIKYILFIIGASITSFSGYLTYQLLKGVNDSPEITAILFIIGIFIVLGATNIETTKDSEE